MMKILVELVRRWNSLISGDLELILLDKVGGEGVVRST